MSNFSTNLQLVLPIPGDPAVTNVWGALLNTDWGLVDTAVSATGNISVAGNSTVILTSSAGAADQSRYANYNFTGALTGNVTVLWPMGLGRMFSANNATTGNFTLTLGANNGNGTASGTTQIAITGQSGIFASDGTNITQRLSGTASTAAANVWAGNQTFQANISVSGLSALGNVTAGNETVSGTLGVTGNTTLGNVTGSNASFSGTLGMTGNSTLGNVSATSLNVSGATTLGNTTVNNLVFTGNVTGNETVTQNLVVSGNETIAGNTTTGNLSVTGATTLVGNTTAGNLAVSGTFTAGTFSPTNVNATGNVTVGTGFLLTGVASPGNVTSTTNDWNPAGLSAASAIRFSVISAWTLTGIVAQNPGRRIVLYNIGNITAFLVNNSVASQAGNRFLLSNNGGTNNGLTLAANGGSVVLWYDGASAAWRTEGLPTIA